MNSLTNIFEPLSNAEPSHRDAAARSLFGFLEGGLIKTSSLPYSPSSGSCVSIRSDGQRDSHSARYAWLSTRLALMSDRFSSLAKRSSVVPAADDVSRLLTLTIGPASRWRSSMYGFALVTLSISFLSRMSLCLPGPDAPKAAMKSTRVSTSVHSTHV
jgi:hypothetical protein